MEKLRKQIFCNKLPFPLKTESVIFNKINLFESQLDGIFDIIFDFPNRNLSVLRIIHNKSRFALRISHQGKK